MLQKIKNNWQQLTHSQPGRRFQQRYERRHRNADKGPNVGMLLNVGAGLAIVAAGLFFLPAPGPGSLIIIVGLGLIGGEFLPLARLLDRAEVKARELAKWGKQRWARLAVPAKIVLVLAALACAVPLAIAVFNLLFGGSKR